METTKYIIRYGRYTDDVLETIVVSSLEEVKEEITFRLAVNNSNIINSTINSWKGDSILRICYIDSDSVDPFKGDIGDTGERFVTVTEHDRYLEETTSNIKTKHVSECGMFTFDYE